MPATIGKDTFTHAYTQRPPWDIDGPQPPIRDIADTLAGDILDAGCGSGENALYLASRGLTVTGFDYLAAPIERARQKATERGISARFLVKDALSLDGWDERFDHAIDSGLLHVFSDEDRARYVAGLAKVLRPGGMFHLLCFSDRTPGDQGPRRIKRTELEAAFATGWSIESIVPTRFEVRPEFLASIFNGIAPEAWHATVRRTAQ